MNPICHRPVTLLLFSMFHRFCVAMVFITKKIQHISWLYYVKNHVVAPCLMVPHIILRKKSPLWCCFPDAPWCWHIYLHNWVIFGVSVGQYSSTMDHLGFCYSRILYVTICHYIIYESHKSHQKYHSRIPSITSKNRHFGVVCNIL